MLSVVRLPHKTDGLAGPSHPAHQTGEEETEAEGDDGVAPELEVATLYTVHPTVTATLTMSPLRNLWTVTEVAITQAM